MKDFRKISNACSLLFEFTQEEEDAIHGFIPMTQDIFDSCIKKCSQIHPRADLTYQKLLQQYPEMYKKAKTTD